MIEQQQKLVLSPYMEIYELVIPKDNLLRQIKELVDDFVWVASTIIDFDFLIPLSTAIWTVCEISLKSLD